MTDDLKQFFVACISMIVFLAAVISTVDMRPNFNNSPQISLR